MALSDRQEVHIKDIKDFFETELNQKYRRGADAHGDNLLDMGLLDLMRNLKEETIDSIVYLSRALDLLGRTGYLPESIKSPVFDDVEAEMVRAMSLHGDLSKDYDHALIILMEEVGEAARALLEMSREKRTIGADKQTLEVLRKRLYSELTQVAAVAVFICTNLRVEGI